MIVCFGLCPCQHNGTYTWNVYPATPTKKPAQILRFAESKNEPLSRKILGKAAQNALGKGTGPSNLPNTTVGIFLSRLKKWAQKSPEAVETSGLFAAASIWVQLDGRQYRTRTRLPDFGSCFAVFCGHFLCCRCSVLCCLMLCGFWPCFCRKAKNKAKSRAIGTPTFTGSMISPFDGVLQNCRSIRTMNS